MDAVFSYFVALSEGLSGERNKKRERKCVAAGCEGERAWERGLCPLLLLRPQKQGWRNSTQTHLKPRDVK